jgi:DNA-binding IclR family transcriptional regulator
MTLEKNTYAIQNVEKALDILRILAEEPSAANLPYLAQRLSLSRNRAFRLLATLENMGLVERDEQGGTYHLGLASVELAQRFISSTNLLRVAHPVLEKLARKHDEAVYLAVIKEDEVIFLDMADCDRQIKTEPFVGRRLPFFTNAAGKVIRAMESRDILDRFFHKRRSRRGLPDYQSLETELNEIRSKGFAIDTSGLGEGVVSIAVAVRDYAGMVIGALTVLGPSFRLLGERLEHEIIPSLLEGAELLSGKFGYARA